MLFLVSVTNGKIFETMSVGLFSLYQVYQIKSRICWFFCFCFILFYFYEGEKEKKTKEKLKICAPIFFSSNLSISWNWKTKKNKLDLCVRKKVLKIKIPFLKILSLFVFLRGFYFFFLKILIIFSFNLFWKFNNVKIFGTKDRETLSTKTKNIWKNRIKVWEHFILHFKKIKQL